MSNLKAKRMNSKVLVVTSVFPPEIGGPASYLSGLIKTDSSRDYQVVTFASKAEASKQVIRISSASGFLARQWRLFWAVWGKARDCQVIYAQDPLVVGLVSLFVAKLQGKRLLIRFVGDVPWESYQATGGKLLLDQFYQQLPGLSLVNRLRFWLSKFALASVDIVITPSEYLKNFLLDTYKLESLKVKIIANAVTIPKISASPKKWQLVTVGRLVPWKNLDQVIKAVVQARADNPWELVVVGDGVELKTLKALVKNLSAESFIHFAGRQDKRTTLELVAASRALILYSSYEGQSHTLIEAMMLGTQVLASDITPNRELVEKSGVLVPLDSPQRLAEALSQIAEEKTIKANTQSVIKRFSWDNHIAKLAKYLN